MKGLIYILFILISFNGLCQFNAQYNSYMFNGLAINPAYSGSRECLSILGLHTSQWVGFEGAPQTDFVSLHSPLGKNHAMGLNLFNDRLGVQNHTGIYPSYAYHLKVGKTQRLSFGVSAGMSIFQVRNSEVETVNQDNAFASNTQTISTPNIGSGLYYYSKRFYTGLSAPLLFSNEAQQNGELKAFDFNPKRVVFMLTSGLLVNFSKNVVWKPSYLIKAIPNGIYQLDLNTNFYLYKKLNIGASYRIDDAVVGIAGFQLNENFDVAYSYAYPLSAISRFSSGSHELMVRFEFKRKVETVNPRYF